MSFSEEKQEKFQQNPRLSRCSNFLDSFLYKILEFIPNNEISQIIREIMAVEGEIGKMTINKEFLEKKLNEFEIEYKSKLKGFKTSSDASLLNLRRIIDKKREEFQQVISMIKDANLKKSRLIEEIEINAKIIKKNNTFSSQNRSFEVKSKKNGFNDNSMKKHQENLNLSCNFPKESSFYETCPTHEINEKLAKIMDSDQKELEEKFRLFKK